MLSINVGWLLIRPYYTEELSGQGKKKERTGGRANGLLRFSAARLAGNNGGNKPSDFSFFGTVRGFFSSFKTDVELRNYWYTLSAVFTRPSDSSVSHYPLFYFLILAFSSQANAPVLLLFLLPGNLSFL